MDRASANANPPTTAPEQVVQYYDQIAGQYDTQRFGNSYGAYVDAQERRALRRWLAPVRNGNILDLACGTGRLLDMATHGLDASEAMVRVARSKHPDKPVECAPAVALPRLGIPFDAIFCLHLLMHLSRGEIERLFHVCSEQVRPGCLFIFDAPSALRRRLTGFRPEGWHAATALTHGELAGLTGSRWHRIASQGILFFPIHRLPPRVRPRFRPVDDLIGRTPLKRLSSCVLFCLERKP
jgi:SAM-dependent methyltransferase